MIVKRNYEGIGLYLTGGCFQDIARELLYLDNANNFRFSPLNWDTDVSFSLGVVV